jgi:PAS domain S-box-containing protein
VAATVLVVDDNADMRAYLTRLLSGAGYRVAAVNDGREALEAVRSAVPDLVVSDVMMPGLDGLSLVAALRADPRTVAIPVLLLSARAGEEASVEGLAAGADDYLVKPFAAADLLARVRANVELARLRTHHANWRSALIDSLQEGFFVSDSDGTVTEINTAFTEILGYGPEGLPYRPIHPWWPDPATDPDAYAQTADAFAHMLGDHHGSQTIPVAHHEGHRLWLSTTFNHVHDPDTGRDITVGTFRDVTAEHDAIQRESALGALSVRLSQATTLTETLAAATAELRALWRARQVLAVLFNGRAEPTVAAADGTGPTGWQDLNAVQRQGILALHDGARLSPVVHEDTSAGITLEHPYGPLVLWLELGTARTFTDSDRVLLSLLSGHLGPMLARAHQIDQQRETALALQRAILGPAQLPEGFAVRYEPAARPLQVGGDWYDTIALPDGRIAIVVGDCVGRGLAAAAIMGQLRSACRALLLQDPSPARTLMALDQFGASIDGALCTTVFCGVLDPATGELTYSSAGHPPGILAYRDGSTEMLEDGRSVPLAVRPGLARPEATRTVHALATLLLYTDGLVERREQALTIALDGAAEALHSGRDLGIDDLATHLMQRLQPETGYDDDVALLLYRHPGPLQLRFPAEATSLASVRQALRAWLDQCDLPPAAAQDLLVAAGEACANAI